MVGALGLCPLAGLAGMGGANLFRRRRKNEAEIA
jgi:hypothetical protein